jgi:hypothetical protein
MALGGAEGDGKGVEEIDSQLFFFADALPSSTLGRQTGG